MREVAVAAVEAVRIVLAGGCLVEWMIWGPPGLRPAATHHEIETRVRNSHPASMEHTAACLSPCC